MKAAKMKKILTGSIAMAIWAGTALADQPKPIKPEPVKPENTVNWRLNDRLSEKDQKKLIQKQRSMQAQQEWEQKKKQALRDFKIEAPDKKLDAKQYEIHGTIESAIDNVVVYSTPYDRTKEPDLIKMGFKKVNTPGEARHNTLYNGRMYRSHMVTDAASKDVLKNVGKEMTLVVHETNFGYQFTSVKPPH